MKKLLLLVTLTTSMTFLTKPLSAVPLAALDTETGGLHPETDGLISIGATLQTTNKTTHFEGIILPSQTLSYTPDALKINGFELNASKTQWLKKNTQTGQLEPIPGKSEKETLQALIQYLNTFTPTTPLVGCNINFDLRFLKKAAERTNLQEELTQALNRPIYDIRKLAKKAHKEGKITLPAKPNNKGVKTSLDAICQSLNLKRNPHGFHDGLEDATLTLQCAEKLLKL